MENGAIDRNSIALSFADNTFEPLRRSFKDSDVVNIINGMSKTMLTDDEELINIMFVSAIKPKRKPLRKRLSLLLIYNYFSVGEIIISWFE